MSCENQLLQFWEEAESELSGDSATNDDLDLLQASEVTSV